jgi:hypothetical protein
VGYEGRRRKAVRRWLRSGEPNMVEWGRVKTDWRGEYEGLMRLLVVWEVWRGRPDPRLRWALISARLYLERLSLRAWRKLSGARSLVWEAKDELYRVLGRNREERAGRQELFNALFTLLWGIEDYVVNAYLVHEQVFRRSSIWAHAFDGAASWIEYCILAVPRDMGAHIALEEHL